MTRLRRRELKKLGALLFADAVERSAPPHPILSARGDEREAEVVRREFKKLQNRTLALASTRVRKLEGRE